MPTLGEELRHRREKRSITLAEISEATRIGTRFLKAIETDNFSILPGGIFTRSFIRAYAKHVGMNEDEAIGLYLQQVAGPSAEQKEAEDEPATATPAAVEKVKPLKKQTASTPIVVKQPAVEPSRRHEPVAYRQSTARTSWPTIVIGTGIVIFIVIIVIALVKQMNQGGGENTSQTASNGQNPAPQTQPARPAEQPSAPASQVPDGQPLVVKIEAATGDSWVRYQIDDAKPTSFTLRKGESRDVPPAQNQVALDLGNRVVLKIRINDREASFPPDTPKFKSKVVISRDNFQTYFQ